MLFSIITPCYNSTETLRRTYNSLIAQTCKDFEWIVIDDCSSDNDATKTLILELIKNAPFPVKHHFFKENHFASKTYSKGCELAEGDYICALAHDDEYVPNALKIAKKYIQKYVGENIAGVTGRCVDQNGKLIGKPFEKNIQLEYEGVIRYKMKITAELLNITKRTILEQYVQNLKKGITEGYFYAKISEKYKYVFVNDVFRIYHTDVDTSFTNNSDVNLRYPSALVEKNLSVWNSYINLLQQHPFLVLKQAVYTNYLIIKYKIQLDPDLTKARKIKFILRVTFPFGYLRYLFKK